MGSFHVGYFADLIQNSGRTILANGWVHLSNPGDNAGMVVFDCLGEPDRCIATLHFPRIESQPELTFVVSVEGCDHD